MDHASTRVQEHIGDPVGEAPVDREQLEEIFQDIQADMRFDHELNGCLNCGICTATCPAAHYYDFSPREIVQLLLDGKPGGYLRRHAGKNLGLRPVLHLRRPLPVQ